MRFTQIDLSSKFRRNLVGSSKELVVDAQLQQFGYEGFAVQVFNLQLTRFQAQD